MTIQLTSTEQQVLDLYLDYGLEVGAQVGQVKQAAINETVAEVAERHQMSERRLLFIYRMNRAGHEWPPPVVAAPPRSCQWNCGLPAATTNGGNNTDTAVKKGETMHTQNGSSEQQIIDDSASRQFHQARKGLPDPAPVVIEQANEPKSKQPFKLSDEQIRQAHRDYETSGDGMKVVAKRHGVTTNFLVRHFDRLSLAKRPPGGKAPTRRKRALGIKKAAPAPLPEPTVTETAVIPATPQAISPTPPPAADFIPADFRAKLQAFQNEMTALGVETHITMSLNLTKEVTL